VAGCADLAAVSFDDRWFHDSAGSSENSDGICHLVSLDADGSWISFKTLADSCSRSVAYRMIEVDTAIGVSEWFEIWG